MENAFAALKADEKKCSYVRRKARRIVREMVAAGRTEQQAAVNAQLLCVYALAFEQAYGTDSVAMMQRVSIQVGTEAMLSNAPVLNHPPAKKFVYSDNGRAVGGVSPEVAQTLSLRKPSAIVLDNTGIKHIQERHAQGIDALGMTPEQFVAYALENFDAVFLGKLKNSYRLACTVETPKKRAIIKLQFEQEGEH